MWPIVSIIFGFVEIVVGLRFLFLLLGASVESSLVTWIYNVSQPLVAPFGTIFGHTAQAVEGVLPDSYFETASLVALITYALIGGVLLRILAPQRS